MGPTGDYGRSEGDADATLLDPAALQYKELETFAPGDFCLSGVKRWTKVRNRLHPGKPTLLLLHDRQGFQLLPLLAPLFGEVHSVWSEAGDYAVNINQYLASNRFDYIVVVLGPTSYNDRGMNFFTGPKE